MSKQGFIFGLLIVCLSNCQRVNKTEEKLSFDENYNKYGIIIGIKEVDPAVYGGNTHKKGTWGADKDGKLICEFMRKSNFQIVKELYNKNSTKDSIISCFKNLNEITKEGDLVVFYIRCHGDQVEDNGNDEKDFLDEALMAYDGLLLDDEIHMALNTYLNKKINIVFITDLCHSETIYKIDGSVTNTTETINIINDSFTNDIEIIKYNLLNMAAASDKKKTRGLPRLYRNAYGDYTEALVRALKKNNYDSYYQFFDEVKVELKNLDLPYKPKPELIFFGKDSSFFYNNFNFFL